MDKQNIGRIVKLSPAYGEPGNLSGYGRVIDEITPSMWVVRRHDGWTVWVHPFKVVVVG